MVPLPVPYSGRPVDHDPYRHDNNTHYNHDHGDDPQTGPDDTGPLGAPIIVWIFVLLAIVAAAGAFLYRHGYFE